MNAPLACGPIKYGLSGADWISGRIEGDFSEFSLTNDNGGGAFSRLSRLVVDGVESRLES